MSSFKSSQETLNNKEIAATLSNNLPYLNTSSQRWSLVYSSPAAISFYLRTRTVESRINRASPAINPRVLMGTRVHPVLTTVARINSPDFETEERYNNWIELLLYIESVSSREWIVLFLLSKRPSPPCSLLRALIQRCKNTRVYVINLSQLHTPPLFATNRGNCGAISTG